MVWRLLSIPLILSVILLVLGFSVAKLGNSKQESVEFIQEQQIEILSLNVEKAFYQLKLELERRKTLYKNAHSGVQEELEQTPTTSLESLKQKLIDDLGFAVDVFLIDRDYVIRDTTFAPDLGLDFKDETLAETLFAFQKAEASNEIVTSHPTQEIASKAYKLYTLSRLSDGSFVQLGFIDPVLAEFFHSAHELFVDADGIVKAEIILNTNPTDTFEHSALFHAFEPGSEVENLADSKSYVSKHETLQRVSSQLVNDNEFVEKAKRNGRVSIQDPHDPNRLIVYSLLSISPFSNELIEQYLAKIWIEKPQTSWADKYGTSINGAIIFIIAALLISAFVSIRMRIVSPLIRLNKALAQNQEIDIQSKRSLPQEIRYLLSSYNDYRNKTHELAAQLRHSAITDPLTGLYNRSAIETIFEKLSAMARRNNRLLAIAFIDLDHFKEFNDLYGHQEGDLALIELADSIKETFRRPTDAGIRYGGEEFLAFYESESFEEASNQARRLVDSLQQKAIQHKGNSAAEVLTLSLGLAVIKPNNAEDLDHLIEVADSAVYEAKKQGRNKIVMRSLM